MTFSFRKLLERIEGSRRIGIKILFLLLVPLLSAYPKKVIDRTMVVVNEEVILESDIHKFKLKLKSKSFQELFGGVDDKDLNSRDVVLQLLIEEKIIDQQVKRLDLLATDQEIDGQIRAVLTRNKITRPQLEERLTQLGASLSDYREGLKRQIERRNLIEREIKPSLEVNDEQLRHFYQRTASIDAKDASYKIAHILITPKEGEISKKRAGIVWKEVSANPSRFSAYVKEYSDDETTVEVGGVLGFFSLSQLAKEFRDVVPKTELGGITKPIRTSAGFHIFRVLEMKAGGDFSALTKEKKEALKNQLVASELERKMAMWLERKKVESFIRKSSVNE